VGAKNRGREKIIKAIPHTCVNFHKVFLDILGITVSPELRRYPMAKKKKKKMTKKSAAAKDRAQDKKKGY
jgi:hypothetical protein